MAQVGDSILQTAAAEEVPVSVMPVHKAAPPAAVLAKDLPADTMAVDMVVHDTTYVIVIESEPEPELPVRQSGQDSGMSWIIAGMLLLFTIVAIRFRKNSKFLAGALRDATDTRERGNVFDDTVRESSFMVILNVLWTVCAGILISGGREITSVVICIAAAMLYQGFMTGLYALVGNVFSDRLHTRMWLHGLWAVTGLSTLIFFPAALMMLCYPEEAQTALWIALAGLIIMKILLIRKSFRIFFTKITSWVLFLYYLCSLEVVPIILLYFGSKFFIENFG